MYDLDSGMQGCIQVYFVRARAFLRCREAVNPIRYHMRIRPELIFETVA